MNAIKTKWGFLVVGLMVSMSALAHVNLKNPKGGETFNPGESVNIQWEIAIEHNTQNWDLYFSTDGGKTYEPLTENISVGTLSYIWTVPSRAGKEARIKVVQDNSGGDYSDESGNFTIAGISTASLENPQHKEIILYPNPARNSIHLMSASPVTQGMSVHVIDAMGRMVDHRESGMGKANNQINIDVSQYSSGLYWMVIHMDSGEEVRRFIVQ